MCPANDTPDLARRRTLLAGAATAGLATLAAWPSLAHAAPLSPARARELWPEADTPDEALARLRAGNRRFVAGKSEAPHRDLARVKALAAGQKPFAAFLGCADSRVPVEIVFDQGFGDIFVTRIAGNVADPAVIGSLEFGAEVLGASLVYVLGHSKCGAVSATIQGSEVPGQISTLYQHIRRAAKEAQGDVARAVARNVQIQMEILGEASPVLARRIREGKLRIVGGVYDLETGVVTEVAAS
jgi:carbonic anhydrase